MTDHAKVVREAITDELGYNAGVGQHRTFAALAAMEERERTLVAERDEAEGTISALVADREVERTNVAGMIRQRDEEMQAALDKLTAAEADRDRLAAALKPFIRYLAREGMIYGFNEVDLQPIRALAKETT